MITFFCVITSAVIRWAFDNSHFMHQTISVCHTDHPDSIVSSMACIVDLKNKFLYNWKITLL